MPSDGNPVSSPATSRLSGHHRVDGVHEESVFARPISHRAPLQAEAISGLLDSECLVTHVSDPPQSSKRLAQLESQLPATSQSTRTSAPTPRQFGGIDPADSVSGRRELGTQAVPNTRAREPKPRLTNRGPRIHSVPHLRRVPGQSGQYYCSFDVNFTHVHLLV